MKKPIAAVAATTLGALVAAATASAHAHVFPDTVQANGDAELTIWVPTEKEDARTVKVEVTPPSGISIDSFAPAPGWRRNVASTGEGEDRKVTKITWTAAAGGLPADVAAAFSLAGEVGGAKDYDFAVRQFYSDGDVADWSGDESSDTPAPVVKAVSSLGSGGGSSSTLGIVALVVAAAALVVALVSLLAGRRSLT